MDRAAWQAMVYRVAKSQTPLSTHAQHMYGKTHISQGYTLDSHKLNIHMYSQEKKKKTWYSDLPGGTMDKNLPASSQYMSLIPGLGR